MPEGSQLVNFVLFFAPGVLFVQVLYLFDLTRQRSGFERALWSIILSVPIRWLGSQFANLVGLEIGQGLTFEMYSLAVALVGSLVFTFIRRLFSSDDLGENVG